MIWTGGGYKDVEYLEADVHAPDAFWSTPNADRSGGCGAGKFGDIFIPDTLWGLAVNGLCQIHDFQYGAGVSEDDRAAADRTLRNNLFRWIEYATSNRTLRWLRKRRAIKYYKAVRMFGGPAFWNDKQG